MLCNKKYMDVQFLKEYLAAFLKENGFKVYRNVEVRGESGVLHKLDIIAVRGKVKLAIDFIPLNRDVNLSFAAASIKAMDLKGYSSVVLAPKSFKDKLTFDPIHLKTIFYDENVLSILNEINLTF